MTAFSACRSLSRSCCRSSGGALRSRALQRFELAFRSAPPSVRPRRRPRPRFRNDGCPALRSFGEPCFSSDVASRASPTRRCCPLLRGFLEAAASSAFALSGASFIFSSAAVLPSGSAPTCRRKRGRGRPWPGHAQKRGRVRVRAPLRTRRVLRLRRRSRGLRRCSLRRLPTSARSFASVAPCLSRAVATLASALVRVRDLFQPRQALVAHVRVARRTCRPRARWSGRRSRASARPAGACRLPAACASFSASAAAASVSAPSSRGRGPRPGLRAEAAAASIAARVRGARRRPA